MMARTEKEISKCEFILLVLTLMDKVEERDIFLVGKLFENWDTNLDGTKSKNYYYYYYLTIF